VRGEHEARRGIVFQQRVAMARRNGKTSFDIEA
jgi:hypothetical protein